MFSVYKLIFTHSGPFRNRIILGSLFSMFGGGLSFVTPYLLSNFTSENITPETVQRTILLLTLALVMQLGLDWYVRNNSEALSAQFGYHLRNLYFQRLTALPLSLISKKHSGYILSLINNVSDASARVVMMFFWLVTRSIAFLALFLWAMAVESLFIMWVNIGFLIVFMVISVYLSKKTAKYAGTLNVSRASLLERFSDFTINSSTLKKLGLSDYAHKTMNKMYDLVWTDIKSLQLFHANRWLFLHFLFHATFLSTIGFMLYKIMDGTAAPGILILLIAGYTFLRARIEKLSEHIKAVMELKEYVTTLEEIFVDDTPLGLKATRSSQKLSSLSASGVVFTHADTHQRVALPSFVLNSGDIVSIQGESGQGKSTIIDLLAGLRFPDRGTITTYDTNDNSMHATTATISQEAELFNMSLYDNITLGKKISKVKVKKHLKDVNLDRWLTSLPLGLNTILGEKGLHLSAGQKQRINLVRGLLLKKDLYLIDEPTSHLDDATEKKVVTYMKRHLKGKTAVIVTHRPALLALCSEHYIMKKHTLTKKED